jgi:hypothetical protein
MPATYTSHKIFGAADLRMLDFDPNGTAATVVDLDTATGGEGLLIENFCQFVAGLFRSVGTGTVAEFAIIADTDDDMATTPTVVVTHALGSAPDAVGDTIWLECDVEQIREVLTTATYVGVRIDLATATDECVVLFGRFAASYPHRALTADFIA